MIIKHHLCGLAVAYEPRTLRTSDKVNLTTTGRPQGSLYGQQKRKIADAVEFMRLFPSTGCKPLIFVATSPGFVTHANERSIISKLTANLTKGYKCKNFVWVREFTKKGYPHFHFVADMQPFTPEKVIQLSKTWSSYFGSDAKNSIRLGTKPDKKGKRRFWVTHQKMAWYLTKYLGKAIGKNELTPMERGKSFRRFHVSKNLAAQSEPLVYGEEFSTTEIQFGRITQRDWVLRNDQFEFFIDQGRSPPLLSPKGFNWTWTGHGMTYTGTPKEWKQFKPKTK